MDNLDLVDGKLINGRIENWSFAGQLADAYKAPEQAYQVIQGTFYGHYKISDGDVGHTSRFVSMETTEDGRQIANTASGSRYLMGEMSDEYKEFLKEKVKKANE